MSRSSRWRAKRDTVEYLGWREARTHDGEQQPACAARGRDVHDETLVAVEEAARIVVAFDDDRLAREERGRRGLAERVRVTGMERGVDRVRARVERAGARRRQHAEALEVRGEP